MGFSLCCLRRGGGSDLDVVSYTSCTVIYGSTFYIPMPGVTQKGQVIALK